MPESCICNIGQSEISNHKSAIARASAMASDSPKARSLALITLLFRQQVKISYDHIIHRQGFGITTFSGIYHF
jgi:hypothetical protein